jgi:hypothetical protein
MFVLITLPAPAAVRIYCILVLPLGPRITDWTPRHGTTQLHMVVSEQVQLHHSLLQQLPHLLLVPPYCCSVYCWCVYC